MINYIWPILIVVSANTIYNICAKSMPNGIQPFAALIVTYVTAALLSVFFFFVTSENKNLLTEIQKTNWTSFIFGCSIVALELGYIYVYRAGWKISTGSLVANISLACVLLLIGAILYKEYISMQQLTGMALCIVGIFLISK